MRDYRDYIEEAVRYLGHFPSITEYNKFAREHGYPSSSTIIRQTGKKWSELYIERGEPRTLRDPEIIKANLKCAAEIYGRALTKRQYLEYAKQTEGAPSLRSIVFVYDTFNAAKEAAGLYPNRGFGTEVVTRERCLESLHAFSKATGKIRFTEDEYEEWRKGTPYPSKETIRVRFKTFSSALLEAGYEPVFVFSEETMWKDIFDFISEKMTLESYEKWAKENNRMRFQEYLSLGYEFRETMKKACEAFFSRKQ